MAADDNADVEPSGAMLQREKLSTAAGHHVAIAKAMNNGKAMKQSRVLTNPMKKNHTMVMDCSQNCGLHTLERHNQGEHAAILL